MSKTLHTPPPWLATCDDETTEDANEIRAGKLTLAIVCGESEIKERNLAGRVEGPGCQAGPDAADEVDANARLMSAAPDLLAALQAVVRVADRKTVEFDAARAAIAKATGEARAAGEE